VSGGAELTLERDRDKNPVVASRDRRGTVTPDELEMPCRLAAAGQVDEEDAADEVGSLAARLKRRLTAAAPPQDQNFGADYE
jgi:DNA-directed RNA polymerase subunit omega